MGTAGKKKKKKTSNPLKQGGLQGNDNVFVHFSILESPSCRVWEKYNFFWLPWIPVCEDFCSESQLLQEISEPHVSTGINLLSPAHARDTYAQGKMMSAHKHEH